MDNKNISQRLKLALAEEGIRPAHLAARSGISTSYISKLLSGSKSNLSMEKAAKIGRALRRDAAWLMGHETPDENVSQETEKYFLHGTGQHRTPDGWGKYRKVPIISYAQAGQAIDFDLVPTDDQEILPSLCRDPKAFGLILRGESMGPLYREGDVVIVSPQQELRFERLAVAQLTGVGVCFKLLNLPPAKGMVRLSSYHPAFPPIERPEKDFDWIWPVHSIVKYERP